MGFHLLLILALFWRSQWGSDRNLALEYTKGLLHASITKSATTDAKSISNMTFWSTLQLHTQVAPKGNRFHGASDVEITGSSSYEDSELEEH